MQSETRFPTQTPGVTLVQRENDNQLETLRETVTSSGEVPNGSDPSETIETITITRKTLHLI